MQWKLFSRVLFLDIVKLLSPKQKSWGLTLSTPGLIIKHLFKFFQWILIKIAYNHNVFPHEHKSTMNFFIDSISLTGELWI